MTVKDTCLRGHNISEVGRYQSGGQCKACTRARVAEWKRANRDYVLTSEQARRDLYRQLFGVSYVPNRKVGRA
jgi:hypothetical protein